MLVIRRRAGESLVIGDSIEVVVLETCGNRVKLGIIAPRELNIYRKELETTREENLIAASSPRVPNFSSALSLLRPACLTPVSLEGIVHAELVAEKKD